MTWTEENTLSGSSTNEIPTSNLFLKSFTEISGSGEGQAEEKSGHCVCYTAILGFLCDVTLTAVRIKEQANMCGPNSRD